MEFRKVSESLRPNMGAKLFADFPSPGTRRRSPGVHVGASTTRVRGEG
jgi:hypothetical protein